MPSGPLDRVWTVFRGGFPSSAVPDTATPSPLSDAPAEETDLTGSLAGVVSDGVIQVDASGRVTAVNSAACALFDIPVYPPPPGEMVGQTLLEATHLRALSDLCTEARQTGVLCEAEVRMVGRAERILRARAVPFGSQNPGVLLVMTDQTELMRLRTVRTEFVANVSHELRTPLASIRATAETLLDGAADDPEVSRRFLKTIIREADRLVRLSEDLLDLSRAESKDREHTIFDLRTLLLDVAARLQSHAEGRSVTLLLPPAEDEPIMIHADRGEIDQVLFNLLDNAIKYTPGGGRVIAHLQKDRATRQVAVVVEDSGIGILSQDLPRIFERFWRADRARRFQSTPAGGAGQTGGTGLGLSIVKHIVEAHGGVVQAESELGRGSRFTVLLPLPEPLQSA